MTPEEAADIVDRWASIWISEVVDSEELNPRERYATAPQPLGEEMTEPTITYEELRRAFMEDDCTPDTDPALYALLEKNQPETLFGRRATHPGYGRGIIVSRQPDGEGEVRFAYLTSRYSDHVDTRFVRPESLDLDPAALTTVKDFNDAPEGTIVEMMIEPKGVYVKEGSVWYGTGDVYAYSARDLTKARVIRWGNEQ